MLPSDAVWGNTELASSAFDDRLWGLLPSRKPPWHRVTAWPQGRLARTLGVTKKGQPWSMRNECAIVALDHARNLRIPPYFGLWYLPIGMAARLCAVFSVSAHRQRRAHKMTRDVRKRTPLLVYSDSKRLLTFVKLLDNVIELDEGGFRTAGVHRDDFSGISRHLPPPAQGEPPPYAYCVRLLVLRCALFGVDDGRIELPRVPALLHAAPSIVVRIMTSTCALRARSAHVRGDGTGYLCRSRYIPPWWFSRKMCWRTDQESKMKTKGAPDCNALEVQPLPLLVDKYGRRCVWVSAWSNQPDQPSP